MSVSINKSLFGMQPKLICLHIVYGDQHATTPELSSCDRKCVICNVQNSYALALFRVC